MSFESGTDRSLNRSSALFRMFENFLASGPGCSDHIAAFKTLVKSEGTFTSEIMLGHYLVFLNVVLSRMWLNLCEMNDQHDESTRSRQYNLDISNPLKRVSPLESSLWYQSTSRQFAYMRLILHKAQGSILYLIPIYLGLSISLKLPATCT